MSRYPDHDNSGVAFGMTAGDAAVSAMGRVMANLGGSDVALKDIWPGVGKHIELAARRAREAPPLGLTDSGLDRSLISAVGEIRKGLEVCESPIEKIALPWLVMQDYSPLESYPAAVHNAKSEGALPARDIVLVPQCAFVRFRLDFMVRVTHKGHFRMWAIECDGEEYHTAVRDNARDHYLKSWGIETLRFSGAHLQQYPDAPARALAHSIAEWAGSIQ